MTLLAATTLLVPAVLVAVVFALVAAKRHQPDSGNPVLPASQPRARTQSFVWRVLPGVKRRLDEAIAYEIAQLHELGDHGLCEHGRLPYANAPP